MLFTLEKLYSNLLDEKKDIQFIQPQKVLDVCNINIKKKSGFINLFLRPAINKSCRKDQMRDNPYQMQDAELPHIYSEIMTGKFFSGEKRYEADAKETMKVWTRFTGEFLRQLAQLQQTLKKCEYSPKKLEAFNKVTFEECIQNQEEYLGKELPGFVTQLTKLMSDSQKQEEFFLWTLILAVWGPTRVKELSFLWETDSIPKRFCFKDYRNFYLDKKLLSQLRLQEISENLFFKISYNNKNYSICDLPEDFYLQQTIPVITGRSSYGKTTQLKKLCDILAKDENNREENAFIPFYIPCEELDLLQKKSCQNKGLPEFQVKHPLLNYLYTNCGEYFDAQNCQELEELFDKDKKSQYRYLILIDGLNKYQQPLEDVFNDMASLQKKTHVTVMATTQKMPKKFMSKSYKVYSASSLEQNQMECFMKEKGVTVLNEILNVLKTPMFLKMYSETVTIKDTHTSYISKMQLFEDYFYNLWKKYGKIPEVEKLLDETVPQLAYRMFMNNAIYEKWDEDKTVSPYIEYLGEDYLNILAPDSDSQHTYKFRHDMLFSYFVYKYFENNQESQNAILIKLEESLRYPNENPEDIMLARRMGFLDLADFIFEYCADEPEMFEPKLLAAFLSEYAGVYDDLGDRERTFMATIVAGQQMEAYVRQKGELSAEEKYEFAKHYNMLYYAIISMKNYEECADFISNAFPQSCVMAEYKDIIAIHEYGENLLKKAQGYAANLYENYPEDLRYIFLYPKVQNNMGSIEYSRGNYEKSMELHTAVMQAREKRQKKLEKENCSSDKLVRSKIDVARSYEAIASDKYQLGMAHTATGSKTKEKRKTLLEESIISFNDALEIRKECLNGREENTNDWILKNKIRCLGPEIELLRMNSVQNSKQESKQDGKSYLDLLCRANELLKAASAYPMETMGLLIHMTNIFANARAAKVEELSEKPDFPDILENMKKSYKKLPETVKGRMDEEINRKIQKTGRPYMSNVNYYTESIWKIKKNKDTEVYDIVLKEDTNG